MPLLKVVVSSTQNSTETVAALERDLLDDQKSSSAKDEEMADELNQPGNDNSQVCIKFAIFMNQCCSCIVHLTGGECQFSAALGS